MAVQVTRAERRRGGSRPLAELLSSEIVRAEERSKKVTNHGCSNCMSRLVR